jgi:hypothetical protein
MPAPEEDRSMSAGVGGGSVVILYGHPLLGEGIARYVRNQTGIRATVAPAGDCDAVTAALQADPSVVIYEPSGSLDQGRLATLAPGAVLIDVSAAVSRGTAAPSTAPAMEAILATVCAQVEHAAREGLPGSHRAAV